MSYLENVRKKNFPCKKLENFFSKQITAKLKTNKFSRSLSFVQPGVSAIILILTSRHTNV